MGQFKKIGLVALMLSCMLDSSFQMPAEDQIRLAAPTDITSLQEELLEEKSKREKLESDLEKMTSLVYELLKSVNKLTKEYASKADIEEIKDSLTQNEAKLGEIANKQEEGNGRSDADLNNKLTGVFDSIKDSKDSVTAVVEDALYTMNKKFDDLKSDMLSKLESKVKRSNEAGKFVSEESFEVVARQVEALKGLPESLNAKVDQTYSKLSKGMGMSTITRDEFAKFKLNVARDTSHLRFNEGQWVKIQQRGQHENSEDYFSRNLIEYVNGFGDPSKEFWLGLDKIASLTKGGAELRIELETFEGATVHAIYSNFEVRGDEFRIYVSGYQGNAGDPLRIDNGMGFSTKDMDKDRWSGSCSETRGNGGWWFNGCGLANLNGKNLGANKKSYDGILWYFYAKDNRSFKSSSMMIKKK
eukprot:TRINITY_DN32214_c0_g1_i1.p1 TRINITY_DN32214_c0_g1~~TRINITY_DN32214_c0_g1_i1.p1  ORF type:complete len:415 (+),score=106.51 TRINITY_DN32214_c0_g1_i1:48-1292(+)